MPLKFSTKIRRRIKKSALQHGAVKTAGLCLIWPAMFAYWKATEQTPFERQRRKAGENFDREYCVDTARHRNTEWAADVDSENWAEGTGYAATPPDTVRTAVEKLPINHGEYVFIDLGSGKGRVFLVASEFPFKECLGVEYAPDLHEVAARNIASFTSDKQQCMVLKSYCHDAASFPLPKTPLVLFFAHPFGEVVLNGFLENLQQSLDETPRRVYVIYYDPICIEQFRSFGMYEIASHDLPKINRFHNRLGKEFVVLVKDPVPS